MNLAHKKKLGQFTIWEKFPNNPVIFFSMGYLQSVPDDNNDDDEDDDHYDNFDDGDGEYDDDDLYHHLSCLYKSHFIITKFLRSHK